MNNSFLILQLQNIENAKRENRLRVANLVINNKELFKPLLEIVFEVNNKLSIRAAWVLEFVCAKKLVWLAPYLTYFTSKLNTVKFDSAVRPVSKICEFLAKAYYSKDKTLIQSELTDLHIEKMIEAGFDWLIGNQKVAVKAYTMEMLYLFGKQKKWVHEELKLVILQNITHQSSGYKARAKKILNLINKK